MVVAQSGDYYSGESYSWTIPADQTTFRPKTESGYFKLDINTVNTSGSVTLTLAESDSYLPAVAPHDTARVQVKLPPSGPTVRMSHRDPTARVNEGEVVELEMVFMTGTGVAQPKNEIRLEVFTQESETASLKDYTHIAKNFSVAAQDWIDLGDGSYSYTLIIPIKTTEDDEYEEDETFRVGARNIPGEPPAGYPGGLRGRRWSPSSTTTMTWVLRVWRCRRHRPGATMARATPSISPSRSTARLRLPARRSSPSIWVARPARLTMKAAPAPSSWRSRTRWQTATRTTTASPGGPTRSA